ncbi:Antibiotic biosynthesis monooxygenase [Actinacidiphila alni]|uniref:Antibiotic biosynthesis monooxygenase n=1 Tax=Actinacidiphila alni TaxID=380248 RepID=A0A1I2CFI7_9ACTN|nr:antibiotic biosynthesis monooxygenase [Actinacidiphila alni]SFE67028.1 Antibiotic biosynthesis monooxygenase [Actinacidiphila alni]
MAQETNQQTKAAPPDIRRADSTAVHVAQWYVPDRETGVATLDRAVAQWDAARWPSGIRSVNAYLSTEHDTVLTYVQTSDPAAHAAFTAGLTDLAGAATVAYTLHRAIVLHHGPLVPASFVVATFDVDGPHAQRGIVDSVAGALEQAPGDRHPGLLSANFHLSADGTRVLNYAEWTSDEAHISFLEGATRAATLRATHDTPGVRPIGFKRYHLLHSRAV